MIACLQYFRVSCIQMCYLVAKNQPKDFTRFIHIIKIVFLFASSLRRYCHDLKDIYNYLHNRPFVLDIKTKLQLGYI